MLQDRADAAHTADKADETQRFMDAMAPSAGEHATAPILGTRMHTDLFQYWLSLPRGSGLPSSSDFDPAAIRSWLADMTIMSVNGPGDIRHRLVGTGIADRLGYDATGKNLLDFIDPSYREQCARDMHEVAWRPCGWQVRYLTHYPSGRVANVQSIYLPLKGPAGQPPRIVSVHTPEDAQRYARGSAEPNFASSIDRMVWIDLGFGVPGCPR
ncbi:PAS domain-containing protein [Parvibaculum sp.]|uniref:PAS domain-containing protein n=1 Tax=Parvibaculum sp. TaxID=2024848 RepID=UPI003BAA3D5B